MLLDIIARDNQLEGTFRGRREKSVYVPHSYRDRQITLITSLLEASGYIGAQSVTFIAPDQKINPNVAEYATVEQHYAYANPKDLLLRHDSNLQMLDTCAVTSSMLDKLQNTVQNVVDGWVDMAVGKANHLRHILSNAS